MLKAGNSTLSHRTLLRGRGNWLGCLPGNRSWILDRAVLKFYLYSGARIATCCKLKVSDFQQEGDEAMIRFHLCSAVR